MPAAFDGSIITKPPTAYQRSSAISPPAITSIRNRCAAKPTMIATKAEPPSAAAGRKNDRSTIGTTIVVT